MKIFVMVDMEGISGICLSSQVLNGEPNYQAGRKYMTWDVNACVDGCIRGGATEVVVRDCHCTGYNFIWEELDPRAEYIQGATSERMPGISGFDGLILLGYHAMAGTVGGVLEHTMSSKAWQNLHINGVRSGETAIDAGVAGDHGVPVIMVSGDDKLCAEAAGLLKGTVCVETKKGLGIEGALLLTKEKAHKAIRDGAARAVKNCRKIRPMVFSKPVTLTLELVSRGRLPFTRQNVRIVDGRTYEVSAASVEEALNML